MSQQGNDVYELLTRQANLVTFCTCLFEGVLSAQERVWILYRRQDTLYVQAKGEGSGSYEVYEQPYSAYNEPQLPLTDLYTVLKTGVRDKKGQVFPMYTAGELLGLIYLSKPLAKQALLVSLLPQIAAQLKAFMCQQRLNEKRKALENSDLTIREFSAQEQAFSALLTELHEITMALSKVNSLDEVYHLAVESGISRLQIDRMAIFIMDREKDTYVGTYGTDEQGNVVDESYFQNKIPNVPFVQQALKHKDHLSIWEDTSILHDSVEIGRGWNALIALWHGDETIGWIACDNLINKKPLPEYQKEILILLSSTLGQMIMTKQAEEEVIQLNKDLEFRVRERTAELAEAYRSLAQANTALEEMSSMDSLTGLSNRRSFDEALAREWMLAQRRNTTLSLILFDVDFFKQYNDKKGHLEGDNCLKRIATALKACVNPNSDLIARYGGEEFVLLCPGIDSAQTQAMAEICRRKIEQLNIRHPDSSIAGQVTISAGHVCVNPVKGMPHKNLISFADQALYKAKQAGRNLAKQASNSN